MKQHSVKIFMIYLYVPHNYYWSTILLIYIVESALFLKSCFTVSSIDFIGIPTISRFNCARIAPDVSINWTLSLLFSGHVMKTFCIIRTKSSKHKDIHRNPISWWCQWHFGTFCGYPFGIQGIIKRVFGE